MKNSLGLISWCKYLIISFLLAFGFGSSGQTRGREIIPDSLMPVRTVMLDKQLFADSIWDYRATEMKWKYKGTVPAVIDFYADWCAPCRIVSPVFDELSKQYGTTVNFYKINTQTERELASVFGVSTIPSFLYIPLNGQPIMVVGISRVKDDIKPAFERNIWQYLNVRK